MDSSIVSETFIEHISKKRDECKSNTKEKRKQKKLNALPGKSICYEDLLLKENIPSTSNGGKSKKPRKIICEEEIDSPDSISDDDSIMSLHNMSDNLNFSESEDNTGLERHDFPTMSLDEKKCLKKGNFVVVLYDKNYYAGLIDKMPDVIEEGPTIDCMEKKSKCWIWPQKKDKLIYSWKDVISKIEPPKLLNKRGHFKVPELDVFFPF